MSVRLAPFPTFWCHCGPGGQKLKTDEGKRKFVFAAHPNEPDPKRAAEMWELAKARCGWKARV